MGLLVVFIIAAVIGGSLQVFAKNTFVAVAAPVFLFVNTVMIDEYVLPYRGGGASMWPIALIVGSPIALAGAIFGAHFAPRILRRGST